MDDARLTPMHSSKGATQPIDIGRHQHEMPANRCHRSSVFLS